MENKGHALEEQPDGTIITVETTGNKSASVRGYKPTEEYLYAKSLAEYLWEKHYKEDAPEWEPLADLMGVLSQIDNMIAGI